jgi:hypothetical protein
MENYDNFVSWGIKETFGFDELFPDFDLKMDRKHGETLAFDPDRNELHVIKSHERLPTVCYHEREDDSGT